MSKLTLDDISDLRAYEREREEFRTHVIALKKKRRIGVGPFVTFLFENRDTIRFQIQEMARAEKIISDEGIETELRIYNPLIPEPGHLAATMFIELTNEATCASGSPSSWASRRMVEFRLGDGSIVQCVVDADHAEQLTREDTTAAVHYIHFSFSRRADRRARRGRRHPGRDDTTNYTHTTVLGADTVAELLADLRG